MVFLLIFGTNLFARIRRCCRYCVVDVTDAVAVDREDLSCRPTTDLKKNGSDPDLLEDPDRLAVTQPVQHRPVHRQNFVACRRKIRKCIWGCKKVSEYFIR